MDRIIIKNNRISTSLRAPFIVSVDFQIRRPIENNEVDIIFEILGEGLFFRGNETAQYPARLRKRVAVNTRFIQRESFKLIVDGNIENSPVFTFLCVSTDNSIEKECKIIIHGPVA